ncbi:MAG: mechanosensitive ion channel [bacterium]|nr:mechanosensitive ion channel [bacterium]
MQQYIPITIEFVAMLLVWLVASGLARIFKASKAPAGLGGLIKFLLTPFLVLSLSFLLVQSLKYWPAATAWLLENPKHFVAWQMFWAGVAGLMFFEGAAHVFFSRRGRDLPIPDLLMGIIRFLAVLGLAFCVLRFELGINIGPLLASTALITAVVGFALQGVLGNLLAGLSLHITRSVMPGDWIELADVSGKVMETNWRETRIRTMGGHVKIIPNSKVSESVIHNMVRPNPTRRHTIDVGASYSDAPDDVIAALVAAAGEVDTVLAHPQPDAFVTAFLDFGINYQVRFWSRDYHRKDAIEGDVNRIIWYKFKRAGIEIPFPMSDQLLNDYLMLANNQMKLDPKDKELAFIVDSLLDSDLVRKLVVDENKEPLLTRTELQTVAPFVRRVRYTEGETLFHQGDEGHCCHILVSGGLSGRVLGDKKEVIVEFNLVKGSLVGEMSLMLNMPRSAEVNVTEPSVLLELGPESFKGLLSLNDKVPSAFARLAAERASANEGAMEKWAASQDGENSSEMNEKGFLRRFMGLLGR